MRIHLKEERKRLCDALLQLRGLFVRSWSKGQVQEVRSWCLMNHSTSTLWSAVLKNFQRKKNIPNAAFWNTSFISSWLRLQRAIARVLVETWSTSSVKKGATSEKNLVPQQKLLIVTNKKKLTTRVIFVRTWWPLRGRGGGKLHRLVNDNKPSETRFWVR